MSREKVEALGYTFVESDLPPIVRDWCVGDSVLCLIEGEFDYSYREAWKKLKACPTATVLKGYRIFAGFIVLDDTSEKLRKL